MDFDGFAETLAVNTLGPLRVTQALLPCLRRSGAPIVAVISSGMGSMAYAKSDHIAYRASKAAVNKVVQCLATDLEGERIVVISIHPGWARTDMGGPLADIAPEESGAGIKALLDRITLADTGRFWSYNSSEMQW
jgi:NAD(P)-dependent dehydrogenase (short-subunit alcohol dehydrogenase family)